MSSHELSALFFLQLLAILATCRLVGFVLRPLGQAQAVADMIAGVLLGPSVLSQWHPEWQAVLFPEESRPILYCVSQIGLALTMFLVGVEFRTDLFRSRMPSAASVSIAGMIVPCVLGALTATWMLRSPGTYFAERVSSGEAMLYLGASMCITAFPMLARIIVERNLAGTTLGTLALAAGAMDDAAAWCLLAIVLATFESDTSIAMIAIGGGAAYVLFTLTAGRRILEKLGQSVEQRGEMTATQLLMMVMLVMLGSYATEAIGIHAVFGAFILGCAMPRGRLAHELARQIEPLVTTLLLPLFFAYSGLNTRLDLVATPELWFVSAVVLLAACLGKGAACAIAARLTGADGATALAVGTLMNARGLMELIILNIGLQRGIITPQLFSIMVLMAIATTLMASPLFEFLYGRRARLRGELQSLEASGASAKG